MGSYLESCLTIKPFELESDTQRVELLTSGSFTEKLESAVKNAQECIIVASNRIGVGGDNQLLQLLKNAVDEKGIKVLIYYQRINSNEQITEADYRLHLELEYKDKLQFIEMRKLHAKFVIWDHDNVLVSSINFLSKRDNDINPYSEIGVHITKEGIGEEIAIPFESHLRKNIKKHRRGKVTQ